MRRSESISGQAQSDHGETELTLLRPFQMLHVDILLGQLMQVSNERQRARALEMVSIRPCNATCSYLVAFADFAYQSTAIARAAHTQSEWRCQTGVPWRRPWLFKLIKVLDAERDRAIGLFIYVQIDLSGRLPAHGRLPEADGLNARLSQLQYSRTSFGPPDSCS